MDAGIGAVGYQAIVPNTENQDPTLILRSLVHLVDEGGNLGIVGFYFSQDPGGVNPQAKPGELTIPWGKLFEKGLRLGTVQSNVKRYNRQLPVLQP